MGPPRPRIPPLPSASCAGGLSQNGYRPLQEEEEEEVSAANPFPGVEARPRFEDREGASSAPIFRRGGCPPTLNSWLQRPGGAAVAVTAADAVSAAATPFPASTILPRGEEGVTVPNHYYYHNDMMTMMHLYP